MKTLRYIMAAALVLGAAVTARPCSRVVYKGQEGIVMVGRTLDWRTPIPTNLYFYPQGVAKQSMPSGNRLQWVSKYASVVAVGYDGGVTEGMNQAGLVMNGLFCRGTVYKTATPTDDIPTVSLAMIVSFFLDNFATVDEVHTWLNTHTFGIYGQTFDGGTVSALHWAITDASGDTLIMEYVDGNLNVYVGEEYRVLTNDPTVPQMHAIENYWDAVGGQNMLPGTVRSADRFVRASYFIDHVPVTASPAQAFAEVTSIINNVAVPSGYEIEGQPNLSSTQWKSVASVSEQRYYFTFADSKSWFWVDMSRLDCAPGAPILRLDTSDHEYMCGCINHEMKRNAGFTPMW